jgi:gamma-glutamylcyclotransferase
LHPLRLTDRIPSAQFIATDYLPNWSLCFHKRSKDHSGKCDILAGDHGVHFAIFEISDKDRMILGKIEGVGFGYSEILLSLPDFGDCVSYIAQKSHIDDSLRPYDWYKELVLVGARFHGFPDEYLKRIESIQALCDQDPDRRAKEWETVEMVRAGF